MLSRSSVTGENDPIPERGAEQPSALVVVVMSELPIDRGSPAAAWLASLYLVRGEETNMQLNTYVVSGALFLAIALMPVAASAQDGNASDVRSSPSDSSVAPPL